MDDRPCLPVTSSIPWGVTCTPAEFNVHIATRRPDWIEAWLLDGRVVRGRSILVENDTALLGRRTVPMASVGGLLLVEGRDLGSRTRVVGTSVGSFAVTGAALGALSGVANPEATAGQGTQRGAVGGAVVGLGIGLLADGIRRTHPVRVEGWHDPALAPSGPGLLVPTDSTASSRLWDRDAVSDGRCGYPVTSGTGWLSRCTPTNVLTQRSGADWVDEVTVQLRDGGHIQGRDLVVTDTEVVLDGVRQPLTAVSRVELRALEGPWRVIRPTAKGALAGLRYGLVMGAGIALAVNDADRLWQVPLGMSAFGASTGLTLGLARGRVRLRDVTHLPAPGP